MSVVYVDPLDVYPNAWGPFKSGSCHMFAHRDDLEKLHALAKKIGLRREWFQDYDGGHYDLTTSKRSLAVKAGALSVTREEAVAIWRANRAARK